MLFRHRATLKQNSCLSWPRDATDPLTYIKLNQHFNKHGNNYNNHNNHNNHNNNNNNNNKLQKTNT